MCRLEGCITYQGTSHWKKDAVNCMCILQTTNPATQTENRCALDTRTHPANLHSLQSSKLPKKLLMRNCGKKLLWSWASWKSLVSFFRWMSMWNWTEKEEEDSPLNVCQVQVLIYGAGLIWRFKGSKSDQRHCTQNNSIYALPHPSKSNVC